MSFTKNTLSRTFFLILFLFLLLRKVLLRSSLPFYSDNFPTFPLSLCTVSSFSIFLSLTSFSLLFLTIFYRFSLSFYRFFYCFSLSFYLTLCLSVMLSLCLFVWVHHPTHNEFETYIHIFPYYKDREVQKKIRNVQDRYLVPTKRYIKNSP